MDAFSYLSVLLSIILGLGLTQILTSLGRILRDRDRVRIDWLPISWGLLLIVVYVQVWWAMFGLRNHRDWTFIGFAVVLAQTATLYVMAAVVLPDQVSERGLDLKRFYDRQHRWFFGCFIGTLLVSIAKDVVLSGRAPETLNLTFHGILIAASLAGMFAPQRAAQRAVLIICSTAIIAYIALLFGHLQ